MNPTAEFLGADSGTISQCSGSPREIRVRREATESALEAFYNQVNEIRSLQEQIFEMLNDLLPQILATVLEAELIFLSRTVRLSLLHRLAGIKVCLRPAHRKLSEASLSLWLAEELPGLSDAKWQADLHLLEWTASWVNL